MTTSPAETLLARASRLYGRQLAVADGDVRWTFADLASAAGRVAKQLMTLGVLPGDRVALLMSNSAAFVACVHGTWMIGASVLPLSKAYRQNEMRRYVVGFEPRVLVVDDDIAATIDAIAGNDLRNCRVCLRSTLERSAELLEGVPWTFDPDAIALHQFSSGTTGQAKKIERPHRALLAEGRMLAQRMGLTADDRILGVVPLSHSYGLGDCVLASAWAGASLFVVEEYRRPVLELVRRARITVMPAVPFIFGLMAEVPDRDVDLSSLRLCISAGTPLEQQIFDAFRERYGLSIRQQYGSTEVVAAALAPETAPDSLWASVGRPLDGIEVQIWSAEGTPAPPGTPGQVAIRSPAQAERYSDTADEVNARSFRRGFFLPGDLGRMDADGQLWITGRTRNFIDAATHKVDAAEVEAALASHPGVAEVVVVGIPGPYGSELVKAVVVPRHEITVAELAAHCSSLVADYKVPSVIELAKEIPKSPLGKILRKYLTASADGSDAAPASLDPAAIAAETSAIVRSVLNLEHVRMEDQFHALGGTSLAAVQVTVAIARRFKVSVSLHTLFSDCTIGQLIDVVCERVREGKTNERPVLATPAAVRERAASSKLAYAQIPYWRYEQEFPHTSLWNMSEVIRLSGRLNGDAIAAALAEVVARHDSLRTTFAKSADGEVEQRVGRPAGLDLARDRMVGAGRDALEERLREEQSELFDFERAPPIRARLYELTPEESVLQITANHLIVDATSMRLIQREAGAIYEAIVAGRSPTLPDPPMQLTDYVIWERKNFAPEAIVSQRAYYRKLLDGARPFQRRGGGAVRRGALEPRVDAQRLFPRAELDAYADAVEGGATRFMAATAVYLAALSSVCENEDIVLSAPYNHRPFGELADVCGNFADALLFRVKVGDDPTFVELLSRVRQTILGAIENFVPAVLALESENILTMPIGGINVNGHPPTPPARTLGGLPIETRLVEQTVTPFICSMRVAERGDKISLLMKAADSVFPGNEIESFTSRFCEIVREAGKRPTERLSAICGKA
jgi:long-chain acyl-CoA synthetase